MRRAAGFIVFSKSADGVHFLLLCNARHGTWSVPKGHLKRDEDLLAGAWRELAEETGITSLRVLTGFTEVMRYSVAAGRRKDGAEGYEKEVHLFLGQASGETWTRSSEHSEGAWLPLEDALQRVQHEPLRAALRQAAQRIALEG